MLLSSHQDILIVPVFVTRFLIKEKKKMYLPDGRGSSLKCKAALMRCPLIPHAKDWSCYLFVRSDSLVVLGIVRIA